MKKVIRFIDGYTTTMTPVGISPSGIMVGKVRNFGGGHTMIAADEDGEVLRAGPPEELAELLRGWGEVELARRLAS